MDVDFSESADVGSEGADRADGGFFWGHRRRSTRQQQDDPVRLRLLLPTGGTPTVSDFAPFKDDRRPTTDD
ncbi:hypothetical protein Q1695_013969 [Nippostrongylus brasiliensis]|nr:hypothetical protein Q1695_013969 [Nippostrongylus brasiliensis]